MAWDHVCHFEVDEESASFVSLYKGKRYYFCARECKELFDRDPEMWID